jgi:hypothetical protein
MDFPLFPMRVEELHTARGQLLWELFGRKAWPRLGLQARSRMAFGAGLLFAGVPMPIGL